MKGYWYDKVKVSVFLCNKNDAETGRQLRQGRGHRGPEASRSSPTSTQMHVVETVTTSRSDEAYKHYKEQFGDSPLADSLTPGPDAGVVPGQAEGPGAVRRHRDAPSPAGPACRRCRTRRPCWTTCSGLLNGMNSRPLGRAWR